MQVRGTADDSTHTGPGPAADLTDILITGLDHLTRNTALVFRNQVVTDRELHKTRTPATKRTMPPIKAGQNTFVTRG